jgi:hypothetical protein
MELYANRVLKAFLVLQFTFFSLYFENLTFANMGIVQQAMQVLIVLWTGTPSAMSLCCSSYQ